MTLLLRFLPLRYLCITFLMLDTQQNIGENIETAPNRVEVDHGALVQYNYSVSPQSLVNVGSCGRLRKVAEAASL